MAEKIDENTYACDCGREFESRSGLIGHSGHCDECNTEDIKTGEYRECEICGDEFYVRQSYIERGEVKYCSEECMGEGSKTGEYRECEACGDKFYVEQCHIENGNRKYCSVECYREDIQTGEYRECHVCDDEFYVKQSYIEKGKGKYCSRECYREGYRMDEEERHDSNYGPLWDERRTEALARDSWECQDCGMTQDECRNAYETGLHVHHKTPYRTFDDDDKAHTLDNLVTLCPCCHGEHEHELKTKTS